MEDFREVANELSGVLANSVANFKQMSDDYEVMINNLQDILFKQRDLLSNIDYILDDFITDYDNGEIDLEKYVNIFRELRG